MCKGSRMHRGLWWSLLLLLFTAVQSNSTSPPGKPTLLGCRSPEKETFTCWWEPGSDGGLPTTHRLFYQREKLEGTHECPDYDSAGKDSCFFDKDHTSIWVDYYLTVVASNALGNATSDTLKVDVVEIVKPHAPENVTVQVMKREDSEYLHVQWEQPYDADTSSGWVTVEYELRCKEENGNEWKTYMSGTQTHFSLYNVDPGVLYVVQVRCRLDHGSWSEWSNSTSERTSSYPQNEKPFWILVSTLATVPFLTAMCILVMKRKHVKQWLLPPVPGPKIRGIDVQLLKNGRSEDVSNALMVNQSFPPVANWKDEAEEYLIVSDDVIPPDHSGSKKHKQSLNILAGIHLNLDVPREESNPGQMDWETSEGRQDEVNNFSVTEESIYHVETPRLSPQKQLSPSLTFVNAEAMENSVHLLPNSGYVDIQKHQIVQVEDVTEVDYSRVKEVNGGNVLILRKEENPAFVDAQRQKEDIPEDYSRVKEVDGDIHVLLQGPGVSADSSCTEKGHHYSDCTNTKPANPHIPAPAKVGVCTVRIGSEYVDSIPSPPFM